MVATYLTPKRFRTSGTGVDLSEMTDEQLLPVLSVASALVNRYCSAPLHHDFRGGSVTDEQHRWDIGNQYKMGTQRIFPKHRPFKTVDYLQIDVTNTQYIKIDSGSLYLNHGEGWVEPVALALTGVGLFGFTILPAVGLQVPTAKITYDYGWHFPDDSILTTYSGDAQLQAQDQFWEEDDPVVVYKNGAVLPESDYTADRFEGMVTVSGYDPAAMYSAEYYHTLPFPIARATAMIATDIIGQQAIVQSGLIGLSSLKVEEIEIKQSTTGGLYNQPVNAAAAALLDPYVYFSWG